MKRTIKNTAEARKICASRINYAKLKVDGAIAATEARTEENAPVSESSHQQANPLHADDGSRAPMIWVGKEGAVMTDKTCGDGPDGSSAMTKALGMALEAPPKKTIKVDVAKYQAWLDDPDLSDGQKEQILEALWQIILCFVDLGFGVSPLDDACGKLEETEGFCGHETQDVVVSDPHTLSETFNNVAAE